MDYNSGYPDAELSLADFQHIVGSIMPQLKQVNFNGNLGDFASARDAVEIVEYVVAHGIKVNINTNGSLRNQDWWRRLAIPGVTVGFALDGLADTHTLYRQDTDWHKIIQNAQAFIAAGGHAIWRFIPFEHNQHQLQDCMDLAKSLNFTGFENIDEGRNRGPVYSRTGEFSHWIGKPWTTNNTSPDIKPLLESHVTWFDHQTIVLDKDVTPLNMVCQHQRLKEIYLAADGTVYPCCFLGFYPGQMSHPGNEQLLPIVKENNALEYDLEHCIAWFDQVQESWSKNSIREGRLYTCVNSCANRVSPPGLTPL
jgi:sulfatase maturation enzyme AslB (radical SAM superfamily)